MRKGGCQAGEPRFEGMPTIAPYGTWASPLSAADLAAGAVHLTDLATDGEATCWLQADPTAGGRYAVMRHTPAAGMEVISPEGFNARTRVHEYGGGALGVGYGVVLAASWADQRVHRIVDGTADPVTPEPVTPAGIRWQAMQVMPGGGAFVAVRETHGPDRPRENVNVHGHQEAVNELVHVDLGTGECTVLVSGPDFVGGPWPSPDGTRLAWLQWDHPDMPWDSAELWVADLDTGPVLRDARRVAGGPDGAGPGRPSAVADACWEGGTLWFTDDASGWWNLHRFADGTITRVQEEQVDVAVPRWVPSDRLAPHGDAVYVGAHVDGLFHLRRLAHDGAAVEVPLGGVTELIGVSPHPSGVVLIASGPAAGPHVRLVDPRTGGAAVLSDLPPTPAEAVGAVPQPISFPTPDGATAHGLYYAPTSDTHAGPEGERPPLVVLSHGGPTSAARAGLQPTAQYWASRGLAVVDVNYRGSVGYGRAFRDALKGAWGIHDVVDCVAAAQHLVAGGLADPDRLVIEGGSAGGYTTLLALCTTDVWAAGGNSFGVSDLRALARDTHKFESRYLDSLVGAWPAQEQTYVDRSPISHVDTLSTPMIVLQGDEDAVVPPSQSEVMVDALRTKGITHAYLLFAGEQHGFRDAANITRSVEARLAFYGHVLGFTPHDDVALPELVDGDGDATGG